MQQEFARLELQQEVTTKTGATAKQVIIYRPSCKEMMEVLDALKYGSVRQTEAFVSTCVRALNGGSEPLEFAGGDLCSNDNGEMQELIAAMGEEAEEVRLPHDTGDGVTAPLVYTLKYPIKMSPKPDADTLTQIQFEAKRIRELSEFLDATTRPTQFRAFMRGFGTPMGISPPIMSDILIDSLDFVDYLVIQGPLIMGKFVRGQRRWKKTSLPSH